MEDRLLNFVKRKFDEYRKGPRSAYYCGKIDALEEVLKEADFPELEKRKDEQAARVSEKLEELRAEIDEKSSAFIRRGLNQLRSELRDEYKLIPQTRFGEFRQDITNKMAILCESKIDEFKGYLETQVKDHVKDCVKEEFKIHNFAYHSKDSGDKPVGEGEKIKAILKFIETERKEVDKLSPAVCGDDEVTKEMEGRCYAIKVAVLDNLSELLRKMDA